MSSGHSVPGTSTAMALTQKIDATPTPLNIENDIALVKVRSINRVVSVNVDYSYNGKYGDRVNILTSVRGIVCNVSTANVVITPHISDTVTMNLPFCSSLPLDGETYTVHIWMTAPGHGTFLEETFDYKYTE